MKNVACLFNFPSHYRESVYLKMEEELNCDFYFGDIEGDKIKKIDFKQFKGNVKQLKTIKIGPFNWIKNSMQLVFKPYKKLILIGDPFCVSVWVILIINKFKRNKTFLWTHGWYGDESKLKVVLKKLFFNLSDGVLLYGNYAKNLMIKEGFNADRLHVIYNSLDYDVQLKIREKIQPSNVFGNHFGNTNKTLIFVGRLTAAKKLHYTLEAVKLLKDKNKNFNIVFIGKGSELESLKTLAQSLGIKSICWFYGACYDEVLLSALIFNADICVSPGNVGLTAIHALMYGTPVISHSNFIDQGPEFEAIHKGVSGDFFEQDNVQDLTNTIDNWFKQNIDRELVRNKCYDIIDKHYNPYYQLKVLQEII